MKRKMPVENPPAANGHAQLRFCSHEEKEDMKMIVHVAYAEENSYYSHSRFELSRFFSRSVFPTILEPGTGLVRLE